MDGVKIALIMVCTGRLYEARFLQQAIDGAKKFFLPCDILLFTDSEKQYDVACQVYTRHPGWPNATLQRYHLILMERDWLSGYDYIFYSDVDNRMLRPFSDEILADGITVVQHFQQAHTRGTPETNPCSSAYLPDLEVGEYVWGGFQGGRTPAFLAMTETLSRNIEADSRIGFAAVWQDESHLNRYIHDHSAAKTLPASYNCYPWDIKGEAYFTWIDKDDIQKGKL